MKLKEVELERRRGTCPPTPNNNTGISEERIYFSDDMPSFKA